MNVAKFVHDYCCLGLKLAVYTRNSISGELKSQYEGTKEGLISDPIHNMGVLLSEIESIDVGQTRTILIMTRPLEMDSMATESVVDNVAPLIFDGSLIKEPEAPSVSTRCFRIDTEITKSLIEEIDITRKKGKRFNEF